MKGSLGDSGPWELAGGLRQLAFSQPVWGKLEQQKHHIEVWMESFERLELSVAANYPLHGFLDIATEWKSGNSVFSLLSSQLNHTGQTIWPPSGFVFSFIKEMAKSRCPIHSVGVKIKTRLICAKPLYNETIYVDYTMIWITKQHSGHLGAARGLAWNPEVSIDGWVWTCVALKTESSLQQ